MGLDLFSGSCGIGLFFAALGQTTGDLQWNDLALQTVRSLRDVLPLTKSNPDLHDRWVRNQGISGTTGVAGIVYGLSQMLVYLEDPSLKADAEQFAQFIRPEASKSAPSYSVARRVGGTILGLLAIPENADARRMVVAAGEYLVQTQGPIVGTESKVGAWVNATGSCPVGFYDGIAGISYALLRLFQVTQDEQFRSAALEAIEVERQLTAIQQPPVTWAQGAAGIELARLGCLSIVDTPELRQEVESALVLTQAAGILGGDSLCWGNFGRLELLQVASERFDRPELRTLTEGTIARVIQQADDRGRFEFCPDRTYPSLIPGLFTGLTVQYHSQYDLMAAEQVSSSDADAVSGLSHEYLLSLVQTLTPAYRLAFNLYAIDGYSHDEIAGQLGISVGASKSNLARAREKLRLLLQKKNKR